MLSLNNCGKVYGKKQILQSITYNFSDKIYWIKGKNGSGKSVLTRCIAGIEEFTEGKMICDMKRKLYLPETAVGENWMTFRENIDLLLSCYKIELTEESIEKILCKLEIDEADKIVNLMSVGTAMKVGLFLLFVPGYWEMIILDETLSHLDVKMQSLILQELKKRSGEGTSIFLVNHGDLQTEMCGDKIESLLVYDMGLRKE